jgi:hypothetical protein
LVRNASLPEWLVQFPFIVITTSFAVGRKPILPIVFIPHLLDGGVVCVSLDFANIVSFGTFDFFLLGIATAGVIDNHHHRLYIIQRRYFCLARDVR